MRGEDFRLGGFLGHGLETPPHAWGRHNYQTDRIVSDGNTPTCVGKTNIIFPLFRRRQKHPHMRGEDRMIFFGIFAIRETPPHAWGRHTTQYNKTQWIRNTPTCVGKTCRRTSRLRLGGKHPHMRGEDTRTNHLIDSSEETPPHAWGRHFQAGLSRKRDRNTPTCVGKTLRCSSGRRRPRKHPHMRGEDRERGNSIDPQAETPPHAWGRLACCAPGVFIVGNTPTCVGKTFLFDSSKKPLEKHPHMRGEDRSPTTPRR